MIFLPFFRSPAIGTTLPSPHPGDRGAAAPQIEKHAPVEIEDADSPNTVIQIDGTESDEPEDHPEDDPGDDPEDEADSEVSVGDPALRYLSPSAAVKLLRSQGFHTDLATLRRLVADGRGPPVAHFVGRLGGWRVRFDQLTQWAEWERFRASWQTRPRAAA